MAVVLGLCPMAVGFDGGGSIRIPAAYSNIVGLATSCGRIGFDHASGVTNVKSGPMTTTVSDAALGLAALGEVDNDHFFSRLYDGGKDGVPPMHLQDYLKADLKGVRIGVFWDHFRDSTPAVVKACEMGLEALKKRGAEVIPISIPNMGWFRLAHAVKITSEFASGWDLKYFTSDALEANTRVTVALGATWTAQEVLAAERLRHWLFQYVRDQFAEHSLSAIASPTLPFTAPELTKEAQTDGESNTPLVTEMMKYIFMANFLGLPAVTVPVGFDASNDNMPIGFQLMGNHWSEAKLLRLARTVEADSAIGRAKAQVEPLDFVDLLKE